MDRRVWYIGIPVSLVLAVGIYLGFSGGSTGDADVTATLEVYSGSVAVAPSGADFTPVATGHALNVGDTVRTGPDGRAAIAWFDGSVTRLDFDTTFTVTALTVAPEAPGARVIAGEQTGGSTYNRVVAITDSRSRFEIVTPTVTASVQGTVYIVTVAPDGTTTVTVTEGGVAVEDGGALVEVTAGFMVTIAPGDSPTQVVPIAAGLLESDWVVFNRCAVEAGSGCAGGGPAVTTTTLAGSTTTTSTTVAASPAARLALVGSAEALGPGCVRTFRARLLDGSGGLIDDDTTVITFAVVSGGGSLSLSGGGTARAVDGVATKTVVGDALGVVSLQASAGGLVSEVISFTVVPPRC